MFICAFKGNKEDGSVKQLYNDLEQRFDSIRYGNDEIIVPWFPRNLEDLRLSKKYYKK